MKHLSLHHNFFFITLPYLSWHLRFEPIENPYRPSAISNSIRLFIILLLRSIVENNLKTIHAKMDTGNRIVRDGYANPEHQKAVPLFFSIYILCLSAKPIFNSAWILKWLVECFVIEASKTSYEVSYVWCLQDIISLICCKTD